MNNVIFLILPFVSLPSPFSELALSRALNIYSSAVAPSPGTFLSVTSNPRLCELLEQIKRSGLQSLYNLFSGTGQTYTYATEVLALFCICSNVCEGVIRGSRKGDLVETVLCQPSTKLTTPVMGSF